MPDGSRIAPDLAARRKLDIRALCALIEYSLHRRRDRHEAPPIVAHRLVEEIIAAGVGALSETDTGAIALTAHGVRACTTGSAAALLQNWRGLALAGLAGQ